MSKEAINHEVEFFRIVELENIHTGDNDQMYDVNINNPLYGRYNMANVTEQAYKTSRYYLLFTTYCIEGPEPPNLDSLFAHLLHNMELPKDEMNDVYTVIDTGETMKVGDYIDRIVHMYGGDDTDDIDN